MPSAVSGLRPSAWLYPTFFLLMFLPEWLEFFGLWYEGTIYTHGFLVLAASGFLLFKVQDILAALPRQQSALGFLALIFFCALMLVAKAADIKTIRLLTIPFLIIAWGWAIWGRKFLNVAALPIALLVFASPIWDDMSPIFQAITVAVNSVLLSIVGIPADIHELYITIPAGTFFVAGGCSGVRYLMVGLFLAPFYGYLYFPGYRKTIVLLVLAAFLSMLANWIRVFGIIVIGHVTDMQSSIIEDHEAFGWFTFLFICLIPLFFISRKMEPKDNHPTTLDKQVAEAQQQAPEAPAKKTGTGGLIAACIMVSLVPIVFYSQTDLLADDNKDWNPTLPTNLEQWRGPLKFANVWSPSFVNADVSTGGVYVSDDLQRVQLQIEAYRKQAQGKELIYYKNRLFSDDQWHLMDQSVVQLPQPNGFAASQAKEIQLINLTNGETVLVWSWYQLGDYQSPSRLKVKLVGGLRALTGQSNGSLIALAAECGKEAESCDEARSALERFARDVEFTL